MANNKKKSAQSVQSTSGTIVDDRLDPIVSPPNSEDAVIHDATRLNVMTGSVEITRTRHQLPDTTSLDPGLQLIVDPESQQSAAYRVLRHQLLHETSPQVIAVTSVEMTSGKSNLAVNLAVALGECNRAKVLLIDANAQQPEVSGILCFAPPVCFLTQMERNKREALPTWNVVEISDPKLDVLAIDPSKGKSLLLDAPAFGYAIESLREARYDHIVINCPPVRGSADVNLIQEYTDGLVLFAKRKKNTLRDIEHTIKQLSPCRILGSVVAD